MNQPLLFLAILLAVTGLASLAWAIVRRRRSGRLAALAAQWGMLYAADDRFNLTAPAVARLPVPGAADVVVRDIVYRVTSDGFLFLFTIEYTAGVLRARQRRTAIGSICECTREASYSSLTLAPEELEEGERYEWLKRRIEA